MIPRRTPPLVEQAKFEAMLREWPELMAPFLPITIHVHGGDPEKVQQAVRLALREAKARGRPLKQPHTNNEWHVGQAATLPEQDIMGNENPDGR